MVKCQDEKWWNGEAVPANVRMMQKQRESMKGVRKKIMKRKIVSALLVMSMTASLVACGNSGSGSSDPADESVSVSSSASSESDASASASSESEAEAEESEMPEGYDETSTELYNEALGDFNDALATAKEAETVDER